MISNVRVRNFGPIQKLDWKPSPGINILIGENATGKTFLLKALYATVRSVEEFEKGDDNRSYKQVISDKLWWVFQPSKLADLVSKGSNRLELQATVDNMRVGFSFSASAEKQVGEVKTPRKRRENNSLFIPAKEVLSFANIIKETRGIHKRFGFDDTYYDLTLALEPETRMGNNYRGFSEAREALKHQIKGKLTFDPSDGWLFKEGNTTHPIKLAAEGIKKVCILDRLLGNRMLSPDSFIFFDEPDALLHPNAVATLMDVIKTLANVGIQIFIATHSYAVLKKSHIYALRKQTIPISVVSLSDKGPSIHDLRDGMPDNPIIDSSIRLYEEEMDTVYR
ncbi:MAG: ATP/GTP-binding protein [Pseudodesulfovibrio sp.]|uniref:AAA family ATPase n=1 Tax=Pseudodesulfovibrio sp. TaxID=2035812 RepID=UPI003D145A67